MIELQYQSPPPKQRTNKAAWLCALASAPIGLGITFLQFNAKMPVLFFASLAIGVVVSLVAVTQAAFLTIAGVIFLSAGFFAGAAVQDHFNLNLLKDYPSVMALVTVLDTLPALIACAMVRRSKRSLAQVTKAGTLRNPRQDSPDGSA
jgi:hypothetical protein